MNPIRIAILASVFALSACQKQDSGFTNNAAKPFNYHLMCLKNNDTVLFEEDVYSAYATQSGSGVRYRKHESDEAVEITNSICINKPI